jgi:hypothetical protein
MMNKINRKSTLTPTTYLKINTKIPQTLILTNFMRKTIKMIMMTFKTAQARSFNFPKKGKETTTLKTINTKRLSNIIKANHQPTNNKLKKIQHQKTQESPIIIIRCEMGTAKTNQTKKSQTQTLHTT